MKKKFLILGSTGFIGKNLVEKLTAQNHSVLSFSRNPSPPNHLVEHYCGDFRRRRVLRKLLRGRPDVIICLVGLSGQTNSDIKAALSFSVNVEAHYLLFDDIVSLCPTAKVIYLSSRLEYGKPMYLPVDEGHPVLPLSYYGLHKNLVTQYCQFLHLKYNFQATILRASNPYGPHPIKKKPKYNIVNYFIDRALRNEDLIIYGRGKQQRDYIYIDDLVACIVAVSETKKTAGQIYNCGGGKGISLVEVAREIVFQVGKGRVKFVPWPIKEKAVETGSYISNLKKLSKDTKWKPSTSLKAGVKKTLEIHSIT